MRANQFTNCTVIELDTYLPKYKRCSHETYINCFYEYIKSKMQLDYQEYKNIFLTEYINKLLTK